MEMERVSASLQLFFFWSGTAGPRLFAAEMIPRINSKPPLIPPGGRIARVHIYAAMLGVVCVLMILTDPTPTQGQALPYC